MNLNELINETTKLKLNFENIVKSYNDNINKKEELLNKISENTQNIGLLENTQEVFKTLENKLSEANIIHVEQLCNQALKTIFNTDEIEYAIKIETLIQRNNNQVQFYLYEKDLINNTEVKTRLEDNGFGLIGIIGLVLQIYFIIVHSQQHILFLDESLGTLSKDKLPKLKVFLNELCDKLSFKFILITHDRDLLDLADYIYNVEKGKIKEITLDSLEVY